MDIQCLNRSHTDYLTSFENIFLIVKNCFDIILLNNHSQQSTSDSDVVFNSMRSNADVSIICTICLYVLKSFRGDIYLIAYLAWNLIPIIINSRLTFADVSMPGYIYCYWYKYTYNIRLQALKCSTGKKKMMIISTACLLLRAYGVVCCLLGMDIMLFDRHIDGVCPQW